MEFMDKFVSIILPARNEAENIIPCLQSIAAQDYPKDCMELLIVDGQSTDDTLAKIQNTKAEIKITILENPNRTAPYAMNLGIKAARGGIILRFDGHAIMEPDYVSNCVKFLEQTKADNVGGPMLAVGTGITGRAIALAHQSPFGLGGGAFHSTFEGFSDTVYLGCFPKETFAKYGLYDTRLTRNQDIELNARIRKGRYLNSEFRIQNSEFGPGRIYLTPKIKSQYHCRSTLAGLWSQNFKNGQWVVYTKHIAPYALSLRHFIPLIFVSSLILLASISIFHHPQISAGAKLLTSFKHAAGIKTPAWANLLNLNCWNLKLLALRLLLLELGAYLGAMLLFVIKAGQAKFNVYRLKLGNNEEQSSDSPTTSESSTVNGPTVKLVLSEAGLPNKRMDVQTVNSKLAPCSLLLLPLVFVTLHFSYGLGSIWGLVTLPFWLKKAPATKIPEIR